jgi:hypothetical protein
MKNKMYFIDQQEHEEGLNWFVAGLFIVTQLAGGGIVAMPTALIQSGPIKCQIHISNNKYFRIIYGHFSEFNVTW